MAYYLHAAPPPAHDIHPASRVSPRLHDPALVEMLNVLPDEAFIDFAVDFVVSVVHDTSDPSWGSSSTLQSLKQPAVVHFVRNALRVSQCPTSTVLVALVYLDRARRQMQISRGYWACERAFLGALMLANKYVNDTHYSYQAWADASLLPKREVIRLEREMLAVLCFNLSVRSYDITSHYSALMSRCQMRRPAPLPALPLVSFRALGQTCDEYPPSHWSPAGSSSSSGSPYDSPTLLTPASQLLDSTYAWAHPDVVPCAPEPLPCGCDDACGVWTAGAGPLPGSRPACLPAAPHDPAFPPSPDPPHQGICGDAPGLRLRVPAPALACAGMGMGLGMGMGMGMGKAFDAHAVTLPHLAEVLPPSLVHPRPHAHPHSQLHMPVQMQQEPYYLLPPAGAGEKAAALGVPLSFGMEVQYAW